MDNTINNRERIGNIRIKTGILQGDSLSPLLFILEIDVISKQLEIRLQPIKIKENNLEFALGHTFYMDDLKIITRDVEEMKVANQIIERICTAIRLKINESKSGIMNNTKQELPEELRKYPEITDINPYKYLGIEIWQTISIEKYTERITKQIKLAITKLKDEETSSNNLIE